MRVTQMNSFSPGKSAVITPEEKVITAPHFQGGKSLSDNIKEKLSHFEKDDYILIGLIAVLIFEGCEDYILLSALGYLFFMGIK